MFGLPLYHGVQISNMVEHCFFIWLCGDFLLYVTPSMLKLLKGSPSVFCIGKPKNLLATDLDIGIADERSTWVTTTWCFVAVDEAPFILR